MFHKHYSERQATYISLVVAYSFASVVVVIVVVVVVVVVVAVVIAVVALVWLLLLWWLLLFSLRVYAISMSMCYAYTKKNACQGK